MAITSFFKGFVYALKGIREGLNTQLNLRFHLLAVCIVSATGAWFNISFHEWIAVIICFGMVIGMELMNTAMEYMVNLVSPEYNELAGKIKDLSAGAVLVVSAAAAVIGILIFSKYFISLLHE